MKIRPVGAELFQVGGHTNGRTGGHDKANSRCFANASLKQLSGTSRRGFEDNIKPFGAGIIFF